MSIKKISDLLKFEAGTDPECMILDVEQNKIVSSIPILKRDKHKPIDLKDGFKCFCDNVLIECSVPPAKNKKEFIKNLRTVFTRMQETLGDKYKLMPKASHVYDKQDLEPSYNIDPMEIGCHPSINVYAMEQKLPPAFNGGLRTGSFHLHFGHKLFKDFQTRLNTIKLLDIYVGLSSIIFDKDESSAARRQLYGEAGQFREQKWGLEYRVLSPYALKTPKLVDLVYDLADYSFNHVRHGTDKAFVNSFNADKIQKAINTCDVELARKLLSQVGMPKELMERVEENYGELDMHKQWAI